MSPFSWIQIGLGAVAAFVLSFGLHTLDIYRIDAKYQHKLTAQAEKLTKQCKEAQAITKGANDDLQNKYNSIATKLASYKRLHPSKCVVAVQNNPTPSGNGYAGQNGISTDWLRDYAAECETYRSQRITLEKFIDDTWKIMGQ